MPNREDYAREQAALAVVHKVLSDFRAAGIIKICDISLGIAIADAAQHIENDVKVSPDVRI